MLKSTTVLIATVLSLTAFAAWVKILKGNVNDSLYIKTGVTVPGVPDITEMFSFTCPECFYLSTDPRVSHGIKTLSKEGFTYEKYHVSSGPIGGFLSEAWAVAVIHNIEDKLEKSLFDGVLKTGHITTPEDVIAVFNTFGISEAEFTATLNLPETRAFLERQSNAINAFNVQSVPAVYIYGKKRIMNNRIKAKSNGVESYRKKYLLIINSLLHEGEVYSEI